MRTELGADEAERLGAQPPHHQRDARQPDFGLRRAGDDVARLVAHENVAQPHRDADAAGALDLGAADFDGVIVPEVLLDRRSEPWRDDVEVDRPRAEPQPQRPEACSTDTADHRKNDHHPPTQRFERSQWRRPRNGSVITVKPDAAPFQKLARAIAGHVVVVIPGGDIPMPTLVGGLRDGLLGLGTPHCLSVLMVRPDSAGAAHDVPRGDLPRGMGQFKGPVLASGIVHRSAKPRVQVSSPDAGPRHRLQRHLARHPSGPGSLRILKYPAESDERKAYVQENK